MGRQAGVLAIAAVAVAAAVCAGAAFDRRRRRDRARLARGEIHRWEEEGGAVPAGGGRIAAQTRFQADTR